MNRLITSGAWNAKTVSAIAGISITTALASSAYLNYKNPVANESNTTNSASPTFPNYIFGQKLKLKELIQETPDTKILKFELPQGYVIGIKPGKAILAFVKDKESGSLKVRPYFALYIPEESETLQFAIKLLNEKGASGAMHKLSIGDEVTFRGPLPIHNINYDSLTSNLNFIAGGSGLTPIFSTINNILLNSKDKSISLIYANKDENDIIMKGKIDQLKTKYGDRFKVIYLVDKTVSTKDGIVNGRINGSLLKQYFYDDAQLFICGPDGLTKALKEQYLKDSGLNNKLYVF